MSTPGNEPPAEQVTTPTVSTAPTSGTAEPAHTTWWHWKRLPHHLGRARTSTVILSVLFLAIFTLYLNVRPDEATTDTTPAGGSSDVEAPTNPLVPTAPTTPEPTEEPSPTTEPQETTEPEETTEAPEEDTTTPTTGSTPSSPETGTTEPTTGPSDPTETSDPSGTTDGTTGGTTEPTTASPSTSG